MAGDRRQSREAADRAASLAPDLDRVQTVRGFADLVEFRTATAQASFQRAIALNPVRSPAAVRPGPGADPRRQPRAGPPEPRAGGRARFQQRAAAHLSRPRLFRGAARGAVGRSVRARQGARSARPHSRTCMTRSACRRSTARSRRCASSTSRSSSTTTAPSTAAACCSIPTARPAAPACRASTRTSISSNTGVREATNSLTLDPTNPSAHRFLADIYAGTRRTEVSRVSELLQSQLLQDVNQTPVQPALGETNLNIVTQGGPTTPGLQRVHAAVPEQRAAGRRPPACSATTDTKAARARPRRSTTATRSAPAAFGYDTDGWRDNGDIRHEHLQRLLPGRDHARAQRAARDHARRRTTLWRHRAGLGPRRLLRRQRPRHRPGQLPWRVCAGRRRRTRTCCCR